MIERIIIKNFKSIHELDIELKPINILVGSNGAGKSNFISFFKMVNQIYEQKLQEHIGNNIDKLLYFGRKNSENIYGLLDFNNTNAIEICIKPYIDSNRGYIERFSDFWNGYAEQSKNYQSWHFNNWDNGRDESQLREKTHSRANHVKHYLKSFKVYHFHDTSQNSKMKRVSMINDNRLLRENGENLAAYLYFLQEKHPSEFKRIEQHIRSVAPFFDRFDLEPDVFDDEQIELRWLEKGSNDYFNAYDMSDGTLRFLALTTLLMQPNLPKTIIIDEPELGLHPFAINKLAALIKQVAAKDTQVIVATQSVNFVDNFDPEDVIAVDRKDNQSVLKRLDSDDLKEWLEDYTLGELWNKNIFGARP